MERFTFMNWISETPQMGSIFFFCTTWMQMMGHGAEISWFESQCCAEFAKLLHRAPNRAFWSYFYHQTICWCWDMWPTWEHEQGLRMLFSEHLLEGVLNFTCSDLQLCDLSSCCISQGGTRYLWTADRREAYFICVREWQRIGPPPPLPRQIEWEGGKKERREVEKSSWVWGQKEMTSLNCCWKET